MPVKTHCPVLLLASLLTLLGLMTGGCREQSAAPSVRTDTYVVRGVLTSLGDPAADKSQIMIHHEAIPEFRGPGGKLGMNTMTMPFPLAVDVDLSAVKVNDVVEFTFVVEMDTENDAVNGYHITSIKALPADTELEFNPRPDMTGDDGSDSGHGSD